MKAKILALSAVVLLAVASGSFAIDMDSKFIDSLGIYGLSYNSGRTFGYGLWGETAIATTSKDWSFLLGITAGTDSPDHSGDTDFLGGMAGFKYYLSELTSVSIFGSYQGFDTDRSSDITSGTLAGKHRFIEVSEGVSPFLTAAVSYRSFNTTGSSDDGAEIAGAVGAGCEFMLTKTLSLNVEASYVHGENINSSDFELQDGMLAAFYFTGYWD